MSLKTSRLTYLPALMVIAFGAMSSSLALGQTAPAVGSGQASGQPAAAPEEPKKSKRLDKHAPPWVVIWNSRLWTDAPPAQDFVKATHPDPKSLEYAPLVGKDPDRPKPRDAKGIAALQAELEGDVAANSARGKAINDVAPPGDPAQVAKPAKAAKSAKARRPKRAGKAATAAKTD